MAKRSDDEQLLASLEAIFLAEGYREVTFRDLAKRLGCSFRRLYRLAPSKEGLFLLIMHNFFERLKKEGWRKAGSGKPVITRIEEYLRVGVDYARRISFTCSEDIASLDSIRMLFDAFQEERIAGLREILEEGRESGELEGYHSYLVAEVMILSAKRLREPDFLAKAGLSFSEAMEELSRLLRFGVAKP